MNERLIAYLKEEVNIYHKITIEKLSTRFIQ